MKTIQYMCSFVFLMFLCFLNLISSGCARTVRTAHHYPGDQRPPSELSRLCICNAYVDRRWIGCEEYGAVFVLPGDHEILASITISYNPKLENSDLYLERKKQKDSCKFMFQSLLGEVYTFRGKAIWSKPRLFNRNNLAGTIGKRSMSWPWTTMREFRGFSAVMIRDKTGEAVGNCRTYDRNKYFVE